MDLFPNGIETYAIGGLFIGVGVVIIFLGTGILAGASAFLDSTLTFFSKLKRLEPFKGERIWRLVFVSGTLIGAAIYAIFIQQETWQTDVQWWRLLGGGVLVGVGTRLGRGCTSGHGICGVGSLSRTSILNVITFMLLAIGTALLVQTLGVRP